VAFRGFGPLVLVRPDLMGVGGRRSLLWTGQAKSDYYYLLMESWEALVGFCILYSRPVRGRHSWSGSEG
jgi:hypothetical protein